MRIQVELVEPEPKPKTWKDWLRIGVMGAITLAMVLSRR